MDKKQGSLIIVVDIIGFYAGKCGKGKLGRGESVVEDVFKNIGGETKVK